MGDELPRRVREPDGEPAGALLLFHGRGTDENDLFGLFDHLDPERRLLCATPGAPLTDQPPGGRHWYIVERVGYPDQDSFDRGAEALAGFVDEVLTGAGLDRSKAILGGFSQGAVMAYTMGLASGAPDPAGIVAMSGFMPGVDGPWKPDPEAHPDVPVWVSHGSLDPVITPDFAHRAREQLTGAGLDVTWYQTPVGHGIDPGLIGPLGDWVSTRIGA